MPNVVCLKSYIELKGKTLDVISLCEEAIASHDTDIKKPSDVELASILSTCLELIMRTHDYEPHKDSDMNRVCRILAATIPTLI